jgi:hypothetical protein
MKQLTLAAAICIVTAASSAYAHDSHPLTYDWCKTLTIEGKVEKVEYKDPHSHIFLRLDNGTLWTVDWAPLAGLKNNRRLEPAQQALIFGTRIAVTGAPIRMLAEIRQHFPDYNTEPNPNTIDHPTAIRFPVGTPPVGLTPFRPNNPAGRVFADHRTSVDVMFSLPVDPSVSAIRHFEICLQSETRCSGAARSCARSAASQVPSDDGPAPAAPAWPSGSQPMHECCRPS